MNITRVRKSRYQHEYNMIYNTTAITVDEFILFLFFYTTQYYSTIFYLCIKVIRSDILWIILVGPTNFLISYIYTYQSSFMINGIYKLLHFVHFIDFVQI